MKKIKKIVVSVLFTIALLTSLHACRFVKDPTPVADAIQEYLNQSGKTNELIEFELSDFTSFEWDHVLIFYYPTSNQEIEEALGVKCNVETDLTAGMVFAYKNEAVYVEYFEYNYYDIGKFIIYPHDRIGREPHYSVLSLDEAILYGEKVVRQEENKIYYRVYPDPWGSTGEFSEGS